MSLLLATHHAHPGASVGENNGGDVECAVSAHPGAPPCGVADLIAGDVLAFVDPHYRLVNLGPGLVNTVFHPTTGSTTFKRFFKFF